MPRVSLARLPVTGPQLFGRECELELLDQGLGRHEGHQWTLCITMQ